MLRSMKLDLISTFFTKLKRFRSHVNLLVLFTALYALSACSGAGAGNTEVESLQFGLRLVIIEGDGQSGKAAETFPQPLKVKLTDTAGKSVQGVKVKFRQIGGSDQATILTSSVMTSSDGYAETRIKAPDKYDATIKIEALIEQTNLTTSFNLTTTPTGTPQKIVVQTSHAEIEQAGVPFAYVFRLTDEYGNTVKYNGTMTINLSIATALKSWAGNEPVLPMTAITCLFADGICTTASSYTLVDSTAKTYLTVTTGSLIPDIAKEVTVLPSTEFQIIITNKAGGPAASATAVGAFEGSTVLNADMAPKDFYAAIVDVGGNFVRDADASDNVTWTAVKSNGTSYTAVQPELTPFNGGGAVNYAITQTIITPNILRIRASKTGLNSDETGNIQVDPGAPATFKIWTDHFGIENSATSFKIQGNILDAKNNLCTQTPTKSGISGTASGSLVIQNPTFGSDPTIYKTEVNNYGGQLNFFNGKLIALNNVTLTKGQRTPASVVTKPTISMHVVMPYIELVTDGFDLTGVTDPITVLPGSPRRISFRTDTNNNGDYTDDVPFCTDMANQYYLYNDPTNFYNCLDATAGTASKKLYSIVEDRGGNPLKWTGTAWEMTDDNGTPQPTVITSWTPTGNSVFNFSPTGGTSYTIFNPVQAGYSGITLKLADAAKGVPNLQTYYSSQVSTGSVFDFYAETSDGAHGSNNLISAPNNITLKLVARDATGNTVYSFNGTFTFSLNISPTPAASPLGTAANFPSSLPITFTNGIGTVTNLRLPNAKVNKLTTLSAGTTISGDVKTTNTLNITVDVGPVASLKIRDNANDTGNDLTGTALTFNADAPPTLFTASYDSELNFYRDEIANWSIVGSPLNTSISINALAQSNPISPLLNGAGNNQGTIKAVVGTRNVSTGQVSIIPGAYNQITVQSQEISTSNFTSTVSAGVSYNLRIQATDQYLNKITTFNGTKNLVFTTSGNGNTRLGYNHTLPANASLNFVNGEISPVPTFKVYNSAYTPRIVVDETTSVPSKTGQTNPLTVINDVPYNFFINRSQSSMNAGATNTYFYVYLNDRWGNVVTNGNYANGQIKFYFDSTLAGTDILWGNLGSQTINSATDEATGNLGSGIGGPGTGIFQVTAQQAGLLKPNVMLTAGPLGNANDIYNVTVDPLTTINQIRWVTGSVPQSTYTASKSVPFNEFKVEAVDVYGNRVVTDTNSIVLSVVNPSSGTAGTIIGTTTKSLDQGVINFTDFKYPRAHTMTLRATHPVTGKYVDSSVAVSAGAPNQALVILPGQSLVAGVATNVEAVIGSPSQQLVNVSYPALIYIVDEVFNPVLTWGNSVSVAITDDSGAVISPASTNFSNGTATFTVTSHKQGPHQIIPTASSILNNLTSSIFTVNPGAPTRLVAVFPTQTLNQGASSLATAITTGSSLDQTAGVSFGMTVYATDNFFNIVSDSSTVVSLTLNNDSLATYGSSLPLTNGSVSFPSIRYLKALASTSIGVNVVSSTATYSQIHGSSPFQVKPNTATQTVPYIPAYQTFTQGQLSLSQAVSGTIPNIKAGTALGVRVAVTDAYFNFIPSYSTAFTINMSDANVPTPTNVTPTSGEAIFAGIQWITIASGATCTANAAGLTNRSLSGFNVIASDGRQTVAVLQGQTFSPGKFNLATAVTWTSGAQTRTAGVSYTVGVYLVDDYFNTITTATDTVGINLTTDGTAPAITSKSLVNGYASFNATNTKADPAHTLKATSGYTNNDSTSFAVVPNTAYQAAIFLPGENYNPGYTSIAQARTSAPNNQTAGTSFTATIRVLDQYFNVVNTSGSFNITRNDVNSTMSTTSTFTNGVGTAVITNYTANNVNNLTLSGTGYGTEHNSSTYVVFPESTRYLVTVLDGLGENIASGKLNYAAAVSGTLVPVDADVSFNVSVSARDKYFNLINDNITVSIASPTDPFAILPSSKPLSNGTAAFLIKNRKARNHYLTASGAGYTSINSNNYFVNWLAAENLVILLPGQTLNEGAASLNINNTTHPNAIIGTPSVMTSGQSANLNVYVTDKFFNHTDSTAGTYKYTLSYNDDPYALAPANDDIVSATATFNYLPLRATLSQKVTPVLTTGSINNIYSTPLFRTYAGTLSKTEVLLPNQTLITGTTSRTIAIAYPSGYSTNTDANFTATIYALDAQHNQITSANSTYTLKDQADPNQATYSGSLVSGTATLSVEPVTPGSNHYLQVVTAPSISATHAASNFYDITIGTPSKVLVRYPGQTFTPARRSGVQGLTGTITNQTVGVSFTADVIVTDSKYNVEPVAWNINTAFLADNYGAITPSTVTTSNGSATISVFNQVASNSHQIALTPSTGILSGVQSNSASYTALAGTATQTILVLTGQTHTPGPNSLAAAVTGTPTTVTAGNSTSGTMKLVDNYFNVVSSSAGGVSLSDNIESANISPASTSFSGGIANFTITPIRDGTHTIGTVYAGVATHASGSLTVIPGAATQTIAYFDTQTYQNGVTTLTNAVSGSAPALTADDTANVNVRVVDNYFNTVTSYNGTATLNTTDPVDTEPSASITSGVGSLTVSPVRAGAWNISAAVTSKTALTKSYTVTPGAPYQLVVKLPDQTFTPGQTSLASAVTPVIPAAREAGLAFNASVYLTDAEFNTATSGSATINASWINDSNATINTATPLALSAGTATLNVTPKIAGSARKIRVTPTVALGAGSNFDSSAFQVTFSTPARIIAVLPGETFTEGSATLTGTPTAQTAGSVFNVSMRVTDSYYNTVNNFTGNLNLTSTDPSFSSGGALSLTSGASATGTIAVQSFRKTGVDTSMGWVLTPTSTNMSGITVASSSAYSVNPNVSAKIFLALDTQTYLYNTSTNAYMVSGTVNAATVGASYSVTAKATDNYNNPTTDNSVQVGLVSANDSFAVISSAATLSSGSASLSINHRKAGSGFALTSTSTPSLTSVSSNSYNVNPGSPYTIIGLLPGESISAPGASSRVTAITGTPASQTAGTAFTYTTKLVDQYYNAITSASYNSKVISLTLNNDSLATTPSNQNLSNGVASFSVTNKTAASNLSITATTTGLTQNSDTTNNYTVLPDAVSQLLAMLPGESHNSGSSTLTGTPSTQTAGTSFSIVVRAVDQFYNLVSSFTGSKALSFTTTAQNSPNSTAPSLATNTNYTFTSGETTVTNFKLYKAVASSGTITVTMASPSLNTTTNLITVQPRSTVASIKVKDAASDAGSKVNSVEYSTLDTNPTFYAAAYDNYGNYKSDVSSTWSTQRSVASDLDASLSSTSAASTQLNLSSAGPGTLTVKAVYSGVSDTTGTLTIKEQGADHFLAELESVGTKTADTSFNLKVTAVKSNSTSATTYAGTKTISLSSTALSGSAGCTSVNVNPELPTSATFTSGVALIPIKLKKVQAGVTITAGTSNVASSTTPAFNVSAGAIACLQLRNAASGGGSDVTSSTINLSAFQSSLIYAAGYDANMNSLGDQAATWSGSSDISNYYSPSTGTGTVATVTGGKSGSGTLTATVSGLTQQVNYTVSTGGATLSSASTDGYRAHLLSNTIQASYMWSPSTDETTAWKTNSSATWYTEAQSSCTSLTHRGCTLAFPNRVYVTVTDQEISIVDAKHLELFMRFVKGANNIFSSSLTTAQSVTARNGKLYVGFSDGLLVIDFENDYAYRLSGAGHYRTSNLSLRNNGAVSWSSNATYPSFSNYNFKELKAYYESGVNFVVAGLNQAIQVIKNNAGTVTVVNGPTLSGSLTALALTSNGSIYYGESGVGLRFADPDYSSLVSFSVDSTRDVAMSQVNDINVQANMSSAQASRDAIFAATQDGIVAVHDHTTPSSRGIYNYGIASDALTGFGSYLRHTSTTVSGSISVADHAARPSSEVTMEFFFKPQTAISGARSSLTVLADKATGSANGAFGAVIDTDSTIVFYTNYGGSPYYVRTASSSWNAHQWYHIVGQINSAGQMSLWIDGALESTISLGFTPDFSANTAPLRLYGNSTINTTASTNFSFDELRVSSNARYTYNAATISVPATPFTNDGNTSYLLHFDANTLIDSSSANAAITTAANGTYVVKPLFSGTVRSFTVVNGFNNGSAISGHVISGTSGKSIELRNMQNPSTMSEFSNSNSSGAMGVDYFNTTSPTSFDYVQWKTGTGFILWAR